MSIFSFYFFAYCVNNWKIEPLRCVGYVYFWNGERGACHKNYFDLKRKKEVRLLMSKLIVKNFGPINFFEGELSRLTVIIGPQASGKSTIAKLFFYLKMIPIWLSSYQVLSSGGKNHYEQFQKILRTHFLDLFGPVYHQKNIFISYTFYNDETSQYHEITIVQNKPNQNRNYLTVRFDKKLREKVETLLNKLYNSKNKNQMGVVGSRISRFYHEDVAQKEFISEARKIFAEGRTPVFIPAGRTLLTLLSGQININFKPSDFIMEDFLKTINDIRPQVGHGLEEVEELARKTWPIQPDSLRASLARDEITKILKGKYSFVGGEERIYHNSVGHTKLSVASSGQQESLWVILVTYMLILERESIFTVIEEPEAHLFPESQYSIIKLLSLLANNTASNQILITTHSPYVLESINNLVCANRYGKNQIEAVSKIVKRQMWVNIDEVNAYRFDYDGKSHSIIDDELKMIRSEEIDSASRILSDEYAQLVDFE